MFSRNVFITADRFPEDTPTALIPQPPFSWYSVPGFSLRDEAVISYGIRLNLHGVPANAHVWSESIRNEILAASRSVEAVPLVSLCREFGRFKARAQFMAVALIEECIAHKTFPLLDLESLFNHGCIRSTAEFPNRAAFCIIPEEFFKFLPVVLRIRHSDEVYMNPVVDAEGICYLILMNEDRSSSKFRKAEFDGMQLMVDAIWEEGRVDLFELPICCSTEYLCFRVLSAPLELWMSGECEPVPFLTSAVISDNEKLSAWETRNPDVMKALQDISRHFAPSTGKYCVPEHPGPDPLGGALLLSLNRQKLVIYSAGHLTNTPCTTDESVMSVASAMTDLDQLVTSSLSLRALLRQYGVPVRDLGKLLRKLTLLSFKRVVVRNMFSRAAKWHVRRIYAQALLGKSDLPSVDLKEILRTQGDCLLKDVCAYFAISPSHVMPFIPESLDPLVVRYFEGVDFLSVDNRSLFPHAGLLEMNRTGPFPTSRFVCPRTIRTKAGPLKMISTDCLPSRYAGKIFELEVMVASGELLNSVVCIGEIVDCVLKMRELEPLEANREEMRLKALALCDAGRALLPAALSLPFTVASAIINASGSLKLYRVLRREAVETDDESSVQTLALDLAMTRQVYKDDPELAIAILSSVIPQAERILGTTNMVTIGTYIQRAQAIKRLLETCSPETTKKKQEYIRDGIRCLNKARNALTAGDLSNAFSLNAKDQITHTDQLLAVLYLWNGETGKSVSISREGLQKTRTAFGQLHSRYLNAAFMHARLLEEYSASIEGQCVEALCSAKEAVGILEDLLELLQDIAKDEPSRPYKDSDLSCTSEPDEDQECIKRQLAITAILLKLNVWLLEPGISADLLDVIMCQNLQGSRGILVLPTRPTLKDYVTKLLNDRLTSSSRGHATHTVLELSSSLPIEVLTCCKMALLAKSEGIPVSSWFRSFCDHSLRDFGDASSNQNRSLLGSLLMTFVFVESQNHGIYVGPISCPLVPRSNAQPLPSPRGIIYRDWDLSATLYCLDHGLLCLPPAVDSSYSSGTDPE
jgi:hypothetical protein